MVLVKRVASVAERTIVSKGLFKELVKEVVVESGKEGVEIIYNANAMYWRAVARVQLHQEIFELRSWGLWTSVIDCAWDVRRQRRIYARHGIGCFHILH